LSIIVTEVPHYSVSYLILTLCVSPAEMNVWCMVYGFLTRSSFALSARPDLCAPVWKSKSQPYWFKRHRCFRRHRAA